jgi:hypothetical protein
VVYLDAVRLDGDEAGSSVSQWFCFLGSGLEGMAAYVCSLEDIVIV